MSSDRPRSPSSSGSRRGSADALPRLRQAVIAARSLDAAVARLRSELGLGEPFADPGVGYFGLRNAVFALGDTFLEVISPERPETAAGRLLDRRGCDCCGYMLMFQVADVGSARERAAAAGLREVFAVHLDEIEEVHLHPRDIGGAIVSLSAASPPDSWRWGGPGWSKRSVALLLAGARIAVAAPEVTRTRWDDIIGGLPGLSFSADPREPGLVEITLSGASARSVVTLDAVTIAVASGA